MTPVYPKYRDSTRLEMGVVHIFPIQHKDYPSPLKCATIRRVCEGEPKGWGRRP